MSNNGEKTFSTQKPKLPDLVREALRTKYYNKIKTVRIVAKNELWDFNKNHILANKLFGVKVLFEGRLLANWCEPRQDGGEEKRNFGNCPTMSRKPWLRKTHCGEIDKCLNIEKYFSLYLGIDSERFMEDKLCYSYCNKYSVRQGV